MAWALAREIAADGNDPETDPHAAKIARGVHPDMIELCGKESISAMIRVDDIRELEDRAATTPLEAPRKMALIDPADRMNEAAANALLKILEEPPRRLQLLLVSADPHRLPTTIRSRCTPIQLEPVAVDELVPWLAARRVLAEREALLIATLAEGRPGLALRLADSGYIEHRHELLGALNALRKHGFAAVFKVAHQLVSTKAPLQESLTSLLTLLRDALVFKTRGEGVLNQDLVEPLAEFASRHPAEGLLEAARYLEQVTPEAPYFYAAQARAQFAECVATEIGMRLKGR